MYGLGDGVPLILQGAGTREALDATQAARVSTLVVARGGTLPLAPGRVGLGLSPLLVYGALGLAAAYLIASRKSRGGTVWG